LFAAAKGHFIEIRLLDKPAEALKSEICQWLWIEDGTVTSLHFVSMKATHTHQLRNFREAKLTFDTTQGELQWTIGETISVRAMAVQDRPPALTPLVHLHLS